MNINEKASVNFTSRNINIRTVDNIARRVKQEFPVYSNTYLENAFSCKKK